MRIAEITPDYLLREDEESDQQWRDAAVAVFKIIGRILSTDNLDRMLTPCHGSNGRAGAYGIHSSSFLAPPYDDFWVVFEPRGGDVTPAAGENPAGGYIIYFPMLPPGGDVHDLADLWDAERDTFIHEFTHYLLLKRDSGSRKRSYEKRAAKAALRGKTVEPDSASDGYLLKGDFAGYFNHPQETNAYYQEATARIMHLFRNASESMRRKMAEQPTARIVAYLRGAFPADFIAHLTPENRRKLDKRLARFADQTLRPMLLADNME